MKMEGRQTEQKRYTMKGLSKAVSLAAKLSPKSKRRKDKLLHIAEFQVKFIMHNNNNKCMIIIISTQEMLLFTVLIALLSIAGILHATVHSFGIFNFVRCTRASWRHRLSLEASRSGYTHSICIEERKQNSAMMTTVELLANSRYGSLLCDAVSKCAGLPSARMSILECCMNTIVHILLWYGCYCASRIS